MIHFISPTDTPTRLSSKNSTPTLPHTPPFQKADKPQFRLSKYDIFHHTDYGEISHLETFCLM